MSKPMTAKEAAEAIYNFVKSSDRSSYIQDIACITEGINQQRAEAYEQGRREGYAACEKDIAKRIAAYKAELEDRLKNHAQPTEDA